MNWVMSRISAGDSGRSKIGSGDVMEYSAFGEDGDQDAA